MTGHVGITSSSSRKLGKYPSELNWSSLGDVLWFIYVTEVRTDHAMLRVATNGKMRSGNKGYERRMAERELIMIRTALHSH